MYFIKLFFKKDGHSSYIYGWELSKYLAVLGQLIPSEIREADTIHHLILQIRKLSHREQAQIECRLSGFLNHYNLILLSCCDHATYLYFFRFWSIYHLKPNRHVKHCLHPIWETPSSVAQIWNSFNVNFLIMLSLHISHKLCYLENWK